jgi:hypothetical protein
MGSRRCRRRRRRGRRRDHCLTPPWLCGLPRVCAAGFRPRLLLGIPAGLRSCRPSCWLYRSTRPSLPWLCWASLMRGSRKVRTVLVAVTVVFLTVPANSQGMSRGGKGSRQQNDQQTAQKKQKAEALDKAYQAGLDRIPDTTKKQDPWDNIRGVAPASSSTRPK